MKLHFKVLALTDLSGSVTLLPLFYNEAVMKLDHGPFYVALEQERFTETSYYVVLCNFQVPLVTPAKDTRLTV